MTNETPRQPGGDSKESQPYTHGHSEDITRYMGQRMASSHAAFLIPHLKPGMRLLDCGCGPGTITLGLAEIVHPGEVAGIDFAQNQIEQARKNAAEQKISNIRFEVGNVFELPFPDDSFDAAFCHTLLEHLEEPQKALSEMYRVLKPGGVIGVREGDRGSRVFWPDDHALIKFFDFLIELVRHNGGDPFMGRKVRYLLNRVGFVSALSSASYECYEPIEEWSNAARSYIQNTFGPQVIGLGWASQSEIESLVVACDELANDPDAFIAATFCESVGWKP